MTGATGPERLEPTGAGAPPAPVGPRRMVARAFAALMAAGTLSFAGSAVRQPLPEEFPGRIAASALLVAAPAVVGVTLAWWAWRGWAADPQPRWATAVRWGTAGGVLWMVVGTLITRLVWKAAYGDAGNLTGLIAGLTAPIGFLIGFGMGWSRRRGGAAGSRPAPGAIRRAGLGRAAPPAAARSP